MARPGDREHQIYWLGGPDGSRVLMKWTSLSNFSDVTGNSFPKWRAATVTNGIIAQGGDRHFTQRFAIETHRKRGIGHSMRFAMEHQNPLVVGRVTSTLDSRIRVYPADRFSLMQSSDPDVNLSVKQGGEQKIVWLGILLRP